MSSSRPPRARAFTLVEVMVAAALAGFVLLAVLTTNLQLIRSGVRITHYAEMETQVRRALETLGHDLRCANAIKWNGASDITLTLPTSGGATTTLTYAATPGGDAFFLVPGTSSAVVDGRIYLVRGLTTGADGGPGLSFARFDRDGNPATTDVATKRIQVTLAVGRQARTMAAATEDAVAATFMLRNKPPG